MKTRSKTSWTDPLRVVTRCILGLILVALIQAGNSAGPLPASAAPHQPINATTAEVLTNTDPSRRTHPLPANLLANGDLIESLDRASLPTESDRALEEPIADDEILSRLQTDQGENVDLMGHIGGATYAVAVQGVYAYVGIGPRLVVLDVSNRANPTIVGQTPALPDLIEGVYVVGGYAYIAARYSGLRVVDISNPTSLQEVGAYDTYGYARDIFVTNNLAYLADGYGGLRVIDVADPTAPEEVGFYDMIAYAVFVLGDHAYVGSATGFHVIETTAVNDN